ncbi:MAG: DUF5615 family PIN-like protein [Actinomycetota bacterium]|nr:DUF5615 family PIN-like protein [Actinomycetota bacterium]
MKALLGEHLSPRLAAVLRDTGYDVVAVVDRADLLGRSDRTLFEVACAEARAVVTNNVKDFRPLAAEWLARGRTHPGLILLPATRTRTRAAESALAKAVEQVLRDHPGGLDNSERWIGPLPRG